MDPAEGLERSQAQRSRGAVHAGGHLGQARLRGAVREGQEADQIAIGDREDRPAQDKPRRGAGNAFCYGAEGGVEPGERDHHPYRQDGSRHGVADARNPGSRLEGARSALPHTVGQEKPDRDGEEGAGQGKGQAVPDKNEKITRKGVFIKAQGEPEKYARRKQEAQGDGEQAGEKGEQRPPAREAVARQITGFRAGLVIALAAPGPSLRADQYRDEGKGDDGHLGRAGDAVHVEPHVVDAGRHRFDGEKIHRSEIVERLHQDETYPDDDGGTGERQRDRKNPRQGPRPRVRPTSRAQTDCSENATRAKR